MERFFSWFFKRSLLIHFFTLAIIISGIIAIINLRREARPSVNFDRLSIIVNYRGATAEDVEELVIKPIEEKIQEVDGIEEYRSTCFEGLGQITIKLDPNYPDKDEVVDEVRRNIDQINDFPDEVDDPVINEIKSKNIPVISLAIYGKSDPLALRKAADQLKDQLKRLEGVSRIETKGFKELELMIRANPDLLDKYFISFNELMGQIKSWNGNFPGGEVDNFKNSIQLRFREKLDSVSKIESLPLRSNDAGKIIRVKDVAEVRLQLKDDKLDTLYKGEPAIVLIVVKKELSDNITVVERVKKFLGENGLNLPKNVLIETFNDDSRNVRAKLKIVTRNAIFGLALVMLVLVLTLNYRVAFVTSIGLPIAFLGGLAFLYFSGQTINTLTVLGMIVVLGMLVDDAIVVSENAYFHLENGEDPFTAAVKGVSEVSIPVIATVLTTVLAFLPIVFMQGIMGQFLSAIPITVILILIFSLIEALFILPLHNAEILKLGKIKSPGFIEKFRDKYVKYVSWSLQRRWVIVFALFLATIITVVASRKLKFIMFPAVGISGLTIRTQLPENTSRMQTKTLVKELSKELIKIIGDDLTGLVSNIGSSQIGGLTGSRERGANLSLTEVKFTEDPKFLEREKEIVKKIRIISKNLSEKYNGVSNVTIQRPGPPIGRPIQVQISSKDRIAAEKVSELINLEAKKIKGAYDIQSDLQGKSRQLDIRVKKDLAAELGLSLPTITNSVFAAFDGLAATTTRIGNDEVDLSVSFSDRAKTKVESLKRIPLRTSNGRYIYLKSLIDIKKIQGRNSVQRLDGARTITIFGDVDEKIITSKEANKRLRPFVEKLKRKYRQVVIQLGGSEKDRIMALRDTAKLYILAIIAVFMVISLSFNSILFPLYVIMSIPFGIMGVVWALILHNEPLSMMGLIGVVGLSGVVVNGAIILIQFVLYELKSGTNLNEALINAAKRRFRPIIITTITTLVGLMPTIYGLGGGDPFVQPLALSLGWGLFVATILILLCLPAMVHLLSEKILLISNKKHFFSK